MAKGRGVSTAGSQPAATEKQTRRTWVSWVSRWLVWGGIAASCSLLSSSCTLLGAEPEVNLDAGPQPTEAATSLPIELDAKDTLVLAVAAVNSPMSTFAAYSDLVSYLADEMGMDARFVSGKTYAEINSLVRSGDATLAIVCSGAYVYGHEEFNMELLAVPIINGQSVYHSYLIVHKESPISTWQQLRDRTFAFTDPLSNSGHLVPLYQIWKMRETPQSLFSKYIFTYSHDNSIQAVAGRLVDAASVDSLVYEYALAHGEDEASKTKVIWRSPPYGINPVVVNPALEPAQKARLLEVLLEMPSTERGRSILSRLMFDGFARINDGAYDSVREMARTVRKQVIP